MQGSAALSITREAHGSRHHTGRASGLHLLRSPTRWLGGSWGPWIHPLSSAWPLVRLSPRAGHHTREFSPDGMTPRGSWLLSVTCPGLLATPSQSPSKLCQGIPDVTVVEPPRDCPQYGKWLDTHILLNTVSRQIVSAFIRSFTHLCGQYLGTPTMGLALSEALTLGYSTFQTE